MTTWSNPVRVGSVNGTPIVADLGGDVRGGEPGLVAVTLSADYTMENPPGYPNRAYSGQPQGLPRTVTNGSTISLLRPEAAALVGAGAANYA